MSEVYENVLRILEEWGAEHEVVEHPEVWTCEVMAGHCGCAEAQILKSAVLQDGEDRLWVYVLPGDKKIRANPLRRWLGLKRLSFADPERVLAACGCDVGSIPPFGHGSPLPVILDQDIFAHAQGYLSPGRHDRSIRVPTAALRRIPQVRIYASED